MCLLARSLPIAPGFFSPFRLQRESPLPRGSRIVAAAVAVAAAGGCSSAHIADIRETALGRTEGSSVCQPHKLMAVSFHSAPFSDFIIIVMLFLFIGKISRLRDATVSGVLQIFRLLYIEALSNKIYIIRYFSLYYRS